MIDGSANSALQPAVKDSVCEDCFGTGTHFDRETKRAELCHCKRLDPRKTLLRAARIPERYNECSFKNFKVNAETTLDTALLYATSLVEEYPAVDRGLLLIGPVGVGKTHLGVAIIKGLIEKGFACLFWEFGSLLKAIQDSYNPISKSSELGVLAPIYSADVLVLDELGASIPTDWVRDTMYQIINKRYNDKKLTIFTTNYPDEVSLEDQTSTPTRTFSRKGSAERKYDTLEDRIGTRLRSRIYEMCTTVVMQGEDYRTHMGRAHLNVTLS